MAIAQGKALDPEIIPVELAYLILLQHGQPMYYKDLIEEVVKVKTKSPAFVARTPNPTRLMTEIHTEINMDNRFVHLGKGLWGLRRWAPKQSPTKATPLITSLRSRREDLYHHDEQDEEPHDEIDALRIEAEDDNGWDQEPEGDA